MPVGGITAKVLAAHRQGIKRIIMSHYNERDIDDIPEDVRSELSLIFVEDVGEVLREALTEVAAPSSQSVDDDIPAVA